MLRRMDPAAADGDPAVAVAAPGISGAAVRDAAHGGSAALPNPAKVVVVGGGPAGSFFAIRLLRRARELGRSLDVIVLEKKSEICFYQPTAFCSWEGCNYCVGGISPRLADILRENRITLPDEVVEDRATEVIVHGDWKSIQLPVPEEREMMSVFRGSRPRQRSGRYVNFDTFLLHTAADEGAQVITAEVTGAHYSELGRPVIAYRTVVESGEDLFEQTIEADFAAIATGVNRSPGMDLGSDPFFQALKGMIPDLRPPAVRRAVIAEMEAEEGLLLPLEGEVHFAQYGSKDLDIEMSSLIPKDRWITVALLGKSIDHARTSQYLDIIQQFLEVPHVRRFLPRNTQLRPRCACFPSMTVGAAAHPYGSRLALTGDIAVSRLYKDGLYSAYVTASALVDCVLERGIDQTTLAQNYGPVVRRFHRDNRYGRAIFLLSRSLFAHPALSRILYQALLTERKTRPSSGHRLAQVLWRIASGDDSYRHIMADMVHPASLWLILTGGLLATIRNKLTEQFFGLDWTGVGRYPTGVPLEEMERKRREIFSIQGMEPPARAPQVERMYSIRIRAGKDAIFRQLGAFGDPDRQYFKPRFIHAHRTGGDPNQPGTTICYDITPLPRVSFNVALERHVPGRYLLYRILDGFGRGGTFAFDVHLFKPGVNVLTIYVGFDFPKAKGLLGRIGWPLFRRIFPQFAHDVLWNHSLCKLRDLAEQDDENDLGRPRSLPQDLAQAGVSPTPLDALGERT